MRQRDIDRFWEYAIKGKRNECWLWQGWQRNTGYGVFWYAGQNRTAHRVSFYMHNGYWPESTDHLCRNRLCVNPRHLEGVTASENAKRVPRPKHCPRGHKYILANVYSFKDARGYTHRGCKQCRMAANKEWWRVNGKRYRKSRK